MSKKYKINIWVFVIALILLLISVWHIISTYRKFKNFQVEDSYQFTRAEDIEPLPISAKAISEKRIIKLPILMYHHIGDLPKKPSATRKDLTIKPANFEAEVKWLKEQGFESISLTDLYLKSAGKQKHDWPKKPVIFTFDDGYADVFQNAIPILLKYGFVGSFAIITEYPGNSSGDNFYATWQQIAQAKTFGMEIVCHTQNHFDGTNRKFNPKYIYDNLIGCKQNIKDNLGFETNILIYPYGHYNQTYIIQAKKAGFVMGITVHEGDIINLDDLMQIPRIRIHGQEDIGKFKQLISK